jgi:adenylosuccinate lyase
VLAEIERVTQHDVKAVEYYLKQRLAPTSLADVAELVHLFCTSEDVNNLGYALMIRGGVREVWLPAAARRGRPGRRPRPGAPRPADAGRTHGQPATPTTLGKELAVPGPTACAGSCAGSRRRSTWASSTARPGRSAAHVARAPAADWLAISRSFVERLACAGTR